MTVRAKGALFALAVTVTLALPLACKKPAPPPLDLGSESTGPLVFPPPADGWKERTPLPEGTLDVDPDHVRLSRPRLDAKRHFTVEGSVVRLAFDEPVATDLARAPAITITPAVKGKTVWTYESEVEFRADGPFDPDVDYTLTLPALTGKSGRSSEPLTATFRATPLIAIANKTITYLPKKGEARPVATLPTDGGQIGAARRITVLYDQPVDLALAKQLVTLEDADAKPVEATVDHLQGNLLEGQKIDPRMVVVVRPRKALAAGDAVVVRARPQVTGGDEKTAKVTVSSPAAVVGIGCGYGENECKGDEKHVTGDVGTTVRVRFNNPVSNLDAKRLVSITPAPRNAWMESWDDTLRVSGSFAPSTRYAVRLNGGADDFGNPLPPVAFTFETRSLPASAVVPEGALVLDPAAVRAFPVTTRNVEAGELRLVALPKDDLAAFKKALKDLHAGLPPAGESVALSFTPRAPRDAFVDTAVDLSSRVEAGRAYVAEVAIVRAAANAKQAAYADGAPAGKRAHALLVVGGEKALAAHVHRAGDRAMVAAFRLASGEPVAGAKITLGNVTETADAHGTALLKLDPSDTDPVVKVAHEGESTFVAIGTPSGRAAGLFPALASGGDEEGAQSDAGDVVGMILTDRGIYRPGSKMQLKAYVRRVEGAAVKPVAATKVHLEVRDPRDTVLLDETVTTDARGTFNRAVDFEPKAHTGRVRLTVFDDGEPRRVIASETVRVAAFEAPRFKVDVESAKTEETGNVRARVVGRYLFGAPMGGAKVTWTLKKEPATIDGGALGALGLSFEDDGWGDGRDDAELTKPVTGEAELDGQGVLVVDADPGALSTSAPTELTLEADVTDASHRHVTSSVRTRRDPAGRHAGVRLARHFGAKGALRVELGVVDAKGKALAGETVRAALERISWSRVAETAESGAVVERWRSVPEAMGSCEVTSGPKPVACDLDVPRNGSYRIVTSVRGVPGARASYWAYGDGDAPAAVPSEGRKLAIVADKGAYAPGETAHVFVPSPFARATAVMTVEQGGILSHASKTIEGASGTFDLPLGVVNAPHTHVVVTLLPMGAGEADYRVGALRLPVAAEGTKLAVTVASAKKVYGVRDEAEVVVEVKRDGAPVADADVALAVVDEGVLRLTGFHPPDPAKALHPGRALGFDYSDTRQWLLQRRERAHVAGGGDDGGEQSVDTRRNFVETAAFVPNLTTDAAGRARTTFRLPDNLTELRMMAVVVDAVGRGGRAESSFTVTKPVLIDPVMPRFALRGDTFEAAGLVHNTTAAELKAVVTIDGQTREVSVPAGGRVRVGVPMKPDFVGSRPVAFAVAANGVEHDRAEIPLRVEAPGIEEHPALSGVFRREREVSVAIPADAIFEKDAQLVIRTGSSLYPELGQRLGYLLGYPHGCAEQTTSSTLPLVAARTLVPWTGIKPLPEDELERRIASGLERLVTMQVDGGGLAYWPGGHEPHPFATAYAMRLVVRAKAMGQERGKLLDGMATYLESMLEQRSGPDRIAMAEALALAGKLPASAADGLWDLREKATAFDLGSLVVALGSLPGQEDRLKDLLDRLEASFEPDGTSKTTHDQDSYWAWGSHDRDRAQAVIALSRHRKGSALLPTLATRLARSLDGYTTQATAWSLIALADYLDGRSQADSVDVSLRLEGHVLDTSRKLGGGGKEIHVPLADLRGKNVRLVFKGDDKIASAFAMEATYRRPLHSGEGRAMHHGPAGPSIHRLYTDERGKPVDLAKVKVGQTVRVALAIELPKMESYRLSYLAVTDALPAGFEPADGLGEAPSEIPRKHPFYDELSSYGLTPDHVDVRDDLVQIYFDRLYSGEKAYATYLVRATTPGTFEVPPTHAELMYEPGSEGYGDAAKVVVLP